MREGEDSCAGGSSWGCGVMVREGLEGWDWEDSGEMRTGEKRRNGLWVQGRARSGGGRRGLRSVGLVRR